MTQANPPTKPFKEYHELVDLLRLRQMQMTDTDYTLKKLTQVGYYRLSGFWHICRKPNVDNTLSDDFLPNTDFHQVYQLYIFDKKLRILLLDAIERLEINLRSIIAHEMARFDPLAYLDSQYIDPKYMTSYQEWKNKLNDKINKSRDDFVIWHNTTNKPLPFWVVIETWDFGMLSKYYSLLKGRYQKLIARQFNINNQRVLKNWLEQINIIRNQSAHHSRIWNRKYNPINQLNADYFKQFQLQKHQQERLFARIIVIWYLVSQYTLHYQWHKKIIDLIDNDFPTLPNVKLTSMGIDKDSLKILEKIK
ncbi:Abi family protein [Moraxella haemolytica]|uniref:Abi family protein n=1 Tax=Moraxella haemolytica TaxID=2904119 RepID=UPI0025432FE1|nr:Abi family protein [Moraxella sp. ZY171148]WII95494.1 Abi family protein [Moraxella sp. ZY171148]